MKYLLNVFMYLIQPFGPTAYFTISDLVMRHDIPDIGNMSEQYPHLIFHNFKTRLGERVRLLYIIEFQLSIKLRFRSQLQWAPFNMITLEKRESDSINRMITISNKPDTYITQNEWFETWLICINRITLI